MTLRAHLTALLAAEAAHREMLAAAGSDDYGKATEAVYDAEQTLREQAQLLRAKPAEAFALLAWLEAVARTKALAAALRDLIHSDVEQDLVANAGEQHGAAKRAEARALWALREVVG
jgi:hypothetical protein